MFTKENEYYGSSDLHLAAWNPREIGFVLKKHVALRRPEPIGFVPSLFEPYPGSERTKSSESFPLERSTRHEAIGGFEDVRFRDRHDR
jgi:hypothetical protein